MGLGWKFDKADKAIKSKVFETESQKMTSNTCSAFQVAADD